MEICRKSSKVAWALVLLCIAAAPSAQPIDVGKHAEMFIDERLIETKTNVELKLAEPVRREVVLELDQPGEGPTSAYFTVFRDGDIIRMYYRGEPDELTLYAESKDGIHFTRPKDNVVYKGLESHAFAPFLDKNPAAKPEEKYKALAYRPKKGATGLVAFASPDALHWKMMREETVTSKGQFDSLNTVSWDPIEKKYRLFSRYWNAGAFKGARAIQTATSDDFLDWTDPLPFQYEEGVPIEQFYTNAITRCPGAEDVWLGFPKRFVPDRKKVESHPEPGLSDAVFMSSRDGVKWDRTFLEAWLRPGPDERNWTERSNMTAWGIIETSPTEFSMYVSEHYRWPDARLRRVTIGRHRFASVHAGVKSGEFVTKPLKLDAEKLVLNYATSAAGSIEIEFLDEQGKSLGKTEPIYGDEFDHVVDVKPSTAKIRFVMKDADVYSIRSIR